jgi:4-hydroxybutyrate CoA-transferase
MYRVPRTLADIIVTEYGVAHLKGKTLEQRVESLVAIAHPKFRKELTQQAEEMLNLQN